MSAHIQPTQEQPVLEIHPHQITTQYKLHPKRSSFINQHHGLNALFDEVFLPLVDVEDMILSLDKVRFTILDIQHSKTTSHIINWAYNYWYNPTSYIPIITQSSLETGSSVCFGAVYESIKTTIILMTCSITPYEDGDFTKLYHDHGNIYHHLNQHETAVEVKRFARHPLFDALKETVLSDASMVFEQKIIKSLWYTMSQYVSVHNAIPFYILAPHVQRWFSNAGVAPIKKVSSQLNTEGLLYQQLMEHFPLYWRNNPALYQAPIITNKHP